MNRMKKLLALLLVLALGLSLAACGGAKSDITGTWQGKVDMTEYIVSKLEEEFASGDDRVELGSIRDYLGNFAPVYTYVFNEDGSYAVTVDEASLHDQIEAFKTGLEAYSRYIFAELLSMTLVELGMAEQVNGVEELEAGQYIIRYTSILSNRFDTTAFKKIYGDLYKAFTKQSASKRFSIA